MFLDEVGTEVYQRLKCLENRRHIIRATTCPSAPQLPNYRINRKKISSRAFYNRLCTQAEAASELNRRFATFPRRAASCRRSL